MFNDEARIASQLEHPHIARMLDFGTIGSSYYIAFEYVRGKDLRSIFERAVKLAQPIPLPFLLYVFARIGEGLSYAHARKDAAGSPVSIVHRDVSPQNVILSMTGDVKLIDFGIAKAAGKLSRTAVGAIKGKFGYMSPEQIRGLEIDQRTDVFSLGITMWELFTRQRLFSAENELLVLEKIRNLTVPPPSSFDNSLPPKLDEIVSKALAKNPEDRYQSTKELYRDLNILAQSAGLAATREEIAAIMQKSFPEAAEPTGTFATPSKPAVQEPAPESQSGPRATPSRPAAQANMSYKAESTMAGANDKRSDLDIFEGLGKKGASVPPRGTPPPAPPPSRAPGPPPPSQPISEVGKKDVDGNRRARWQAARPSRDVPPMPPPSGGGRTTNPGHPPPSLPPVNTPPRSSYPPPPPPVATKPAPYGVAPPQPSSSSSASAGGMDMDWDDEDEATHVFDKENELLASWALRRPAPKPAAGVPAMMSPPPPSTGPMLPEVDLPHRRARSVRRWERHRRRPAALRRRRHRPSAGSPALRDRWRCPGR